MSLLKEEITHLLKVIKTASKITEWLRANNIIQYEKVDRSPVTLADYASQYYIINKLKELFPSDKIIAEESKSSQLISDDITLLNQCFSSLDLPQPKDFKNLLNYRGMESNRIWTIDPIDGTKGFIENSWYAIGIGLLIENQVKFSLISIPNYNGEMKIYKAINGNGAEVSSNFIDFNPINVSKINNLNQSKVCHSLHHDNDTTKKFRELAHIKINKPMESMAKFCEVASGNFDLYIRHIKNYKPKIWDYCPGDLLVREAGGKVTDLNGDPLIYKDGRLDLPTPGLIASNGLLHERSLDTINSII
ncbi:MAG: hypothetical protein GF317_18500 [Candidatus Lokiarchaeota archaeon]|nr:hypothetical protein [Candidatus Lokiarchaeota archaeon]MBD3201507.1 hypothetical protein [Candidatus Lokiarchaeota archaeon]